MFHDNYVNTMVADALAPCITSLLAARELTTLVKLILVFHKGRFQLFVNVKG